MCPAYFAIFFILLLFFAEEGFIFNYILGLAFRLVVKVVYYNSNPGMAVLMQIANNQISKVKFQIFL